MIAADPNAGHSREPPPPIRVDPMLYRELFDTQNHEWRIWDTYPETASLLPVPPSYAAGWLTFERDGEKRRLMPLPADWFGLPDEELLDLLTCSEPVSPSCSPVG